MWKRFMKICAIVIIVYLVFRYLIQLVFPFVTAAIVAVIYYPVLRHLYGDSRLWNTGNRRYLLMASLIVFYGILFLLLGLIFGGIIGQGQSIILNFPFYQAKIICFFKNCCGQVDGWFKFSEGESFAYLSHIIETVWGKSLSSFVPKMTGISVRAAGKLFEFIFEMIITVVATFFLIQDYEDIRAKLLEHEIGVSFCRIVTKCRSAAGAYFKTQGMIMLINGILCTSAFYLIKHPYYPTVGPLVAVVDALPIFGAGVFLIPYGLILLLYGELKSSLIILGTYGICVMVRQVLEPKMLGGTMGIRPLYMIIAMYVGFRLFGAFGFVLGPLGLLLGKEIYVVIK